jgi:hypothetical protein
MFRKIPNGCTKRNMARYSRAGPPGQKSRGDPGVRLRLMDSMRREIELEEIEKILLKFTQKEKQSWLDQY